MVRFGFDQTHEGESSIENDDAAMDVSASDDDEVVEEVAEIAIDLPPKEEINYLRRGPWTLVSSHRHGDHDDDGGTDPWPPPGGQSPPLEEEEEEEPPPPNALARIYNRNTSLREYDEPSGGAPVHHYHIYYQSPPPQEPPNCCSARGCCGGSRVGVLLSFVVLLISHVVYRYGPSVPPPAHHFPANGYYDDDDVYPPQQPRDGYHGAPETWRDFGLDQAGHLVGLASSWWSVASHISFWCWQGLKQDWEKILAGDASSAACLGENVPIGRIGDLPLFGQPQVLGKLDAALPSFLDQRVGTLDGGPWFLYATGGEGVGKQHLAKLLADRYQRALSPDCQSPWNGASLIADDDDDDDSSLLFHWDMAGLFSDEMHGWEDATDDEIDAIARGLLLRLSQHAADHPEGFIFLVSHATNRPDHIRFLRSLLEGLASRSFGNSRLVVVLTSSIGSPAIDKAIRRYGGKDSLPIPDLEAYLRHQAVEDLLGGEESTTASRLLEHALVLPFLPLDKDAAAGILRHRLSTLVVRSSEDDHDAIPAPVEASKSTLKYLLDHGLEWETWIHKTTRAELLSRVPNGGWAIRNLLDRLLPHRCTEAMRATLLGHNGQPPHHPNHSFWLTTSASDPHGGEHFRLLACDTIMDEYRVPAGESGSDCRTVCDYLL